jgi:hypothetical protein
MLGIASLIICGLVFLVGLVRDPSFSVLLTDGLAAYFAVAKDTIVELFMIAVGWRLQRCRRGSLPL